MDNQENTLPVNVKQIGTISDSSVRIYMEDYVNTYIDRYSKSEPTKEKIAVLIGRKLIVDGEQVLFISGMIQGRYTIRKNNMLTLTEKSWQYIKKQTELYFEGLSVIGWVYVQPGFEDYIGEHIGKFQKDNAHRGLEVVFITDPSENINSFYLWNKENAMFNQIKGYIIYYEKNEGMHEYMLENKIKKPKKSEDEAQRQDAGAAARAVASTKRSKYKNRLQLNSDGRRAANLLGGVCFVMLMVCFVMGAGLVQSEERLNQVEEKLYFIEAELKDSQAVFAGQTFTEATTQQTTLTQATTQTETQTEQQKKYVVKEGDTLIKICKKIYGTPANIEKIKELNNIDGNIIVVGDTLLLP